MDIFGNNFIQLPKSKTVARYEARLWWPQALSYSLALLSPSIAPLLLLWSSELNTELTHTQPSNPTTGNYAGKERYHPEEVTPYLMSFFKSLNDQNGCFF